MTVSKPKVVEKWQKKNKYGRPATKLNATKVAIHYTGQADVKGINTVNYFNNVVANGYKVGGKYVYASAHYVIDLDGTIYQLIPTDERCYATNSANAYAIAIEVATTGSDNHYTDETYKSMVHLCAWLCEYKGLDCQKDIITHTDVVGKEYKLCPIYMVKNPTKMKQFKLDCANLKAGKIEVSDIINCTNGKGKVTVVPSDFKQYIVRTTAESLNARKGAGTNYDIETKLPKGTAVTIVAEEGNWLKTKSGYWISKTYTEFVRYV